MRGPLNTDEREFTKLVEEHAKWMYRRAFYLCGESALAEDLVQESLLKIWRTWPVVSKSGEFSFRGYFARTLKSCFFDYLKSKPSRNNLREDGMDVEVAETLRAERTAEEECLVVEFQRNIWAAVATLEPVQQELLIRKYVRRESIASAARQLGLAERTANRYHSHALRQLQKLIDGPGDEEGEGGR